MKVVDIGLVLEELAQLAPPPSDAWRVSDSPHSVWSLVSVAPHQRWEAPTQLIEERILLVLSGKATFAVDDSRQTLGSGHLLTAAPGEMIVIINEEATPLTALFGTTKRAQTTGDDTQES